MTIDAGFCTPSQSIIPSIAGNGIGWLAKHYPRTNEFPEIVWFMGCLQSATDLWLQLTGLLAVAALCVVVALSVVGIWMRMMHRPKLEWLGRGFTAGIPSVVVVHGTWGRASKWFTERHLFADLESRIGNGRINRARLYWSGSNNMAARFHTAHWLAKELEPLIKQRPPSAGSLARKRTSLPTTWRA